VLPTLLLGQQEGWHDLAHINLCLLSQRFFFGDMWRKKIEGIEEWGDTTILGSPRK